MVTEEITNIKTILILGCFIMMGVGMFLILNGLTNRNCEENPPQQCYYTSNNIRDNNYTDCKTTQYSEDNLIFPDVQRKESCLYNGERIEIQFKETKYECATSNFTADYKFCK